MTVQFLLKLLWRDVDLVVCRAVGLLYREVFLIFSLLLPINVSQVIFYCHMFNSYSAAVVGSEILNSQAPPTMLKQHV